MIQITDRWIKANGHYVMFRSFEAQAREAARWLDECYHVLEIGLGYGFANQEIARVPRETHVVIEKYPEIVAACSDLSCDRLIVGDWQEIVPTMSEVFDGVFFDVSPYDGPPPNIPEFQGTCFVWYDHEAQQYRQE